MLNEIAERGPKAWFETSTGANIFYRDYVPQRENDQVPLLCLHGFMRNSRDFCVLAETLSGMGYRVIAPDMRGRGYSTWYTEADKYHYDLVKQDIWELLDFLGIGRVAVLGVALGAMIAMDWAGEHPQRVVGYVLNDMGTEIVQKAATRMAARAQSAELTYDEAVEQVKEYFGQTYPDLSHERWQQYALQVYREMSPGRYSRDFDLLSLADAARLKEERPDLWPQFLATKAVPVAILRGENSDFFAADCAQRMVEQHPAAILTTVPGRGHPPLLDEPQSLIAITALLGRVSA